MMKHPQRGLPLLLLSILIATCSARRGALIRDGMSSKSAYDNPHLGQKGDITIDPDVVAITTRCAKWSIDPIECLEQQTSSSSSNDNNKNNKDSIVKQVLSKEMQTLPLHITFRSKTLGANGKRPNWMRASATLGDPSLQKSKLLPYPPATTPVRAVWTCSNADADSSMTYDEVNDKSNRSIKREIGTNVLEDGYEDCLKRLYGKYVELEVLLPRTKSLSKFMGSRGGGPPPSVVYRVPIQGGHVNPFGMVSKSRATVTLYPEGRTLAAANASGLGASGVKRDVMIPLGMTNVHLPLGPGLVDPSWAKGRKLFWKGRSLGLV
eukprot:CAMPEP_0196130214 /NCGR_PEP_ID=MMETSP0910-20130528/666_1 /TAXON_ID=49265 /ORGANISM="Thalassiosira rotula, Strain GSO102" /LENGTH=321 /DNA_ID=CAMNT_0041389475 /DNA_START=67 /DNA_END=1032 /DNA_ORIENTATION=+